ncbi:MAG: DUF5666 domain-containing protein [Candidatus Limnocylindrales bacterium]
MPPAATGPADGAAFPTQTVAPGTPVVRVQPRKASSLWLNVVLGLAALVAVGGIAFAIGRSTAPAATGGARAGNFAGLGGNFPGGSFAPDASGGLGGAFTRGGGFNLSGTVESITDNTLTLKTANGQTLEFSLGADTTYASKTPATAADVKVGSKVEVQLQAGGNGQPQASAAASGPIGTAGSVTVVP